MLYSWIKALRLRTLPLAAAGVILGNFVAASRGHFDWVIFTTTLITALLLQILSNLANDYGDTKHGADTARRLGPERMVQAGHITSSAMKLAMGIFILLSLITGLLTLYLSLNHIGSGPALFLLITGLVAIGAAYAYTASDKPYGYQGLGDVAVFIFFGLVAVKGAYFLQTGYLDLWVLMPATSIGLFSTGVLNINNLRDFETDQEAGKYTMPVRMGKHQGKVYHLCLLSLGCLFTLVYAIRFYESFWQYGLLLILILFYVHGKRLWDSYEPLDFAPLLKQLSLFTLGYSMVFGISLLI